MTHPTPPQKPLTIQECKVEVLKLLKEKNPYNQFPEIGAEYVDMVATLYRSQPVQVEGLPSEDEIEQKGKEYYGDIYEIKSASISRGGFRRGAKWILGLASAIIAKKNKDLREQKQLWIDSESEVRALRKENEQLKKCECGKSVGKGKCSVCDNDD